MSSPSGRYRPRFRTEALHPAPVLWPPVLWLLAPLLLATSCTRSGPEPLTVRAVMQERPGGPAEEVEVEVHRAPVDLPLIPAAEADLPPEDLVLGVAVDGEAVAYPVRYLALTEVANSRAGDFPLAPTW